MAAGPMALDATPPVAPDVSSQMGAGPESSFAGIGKMLRDQDQQNGQDSQDFSSIEKAHPQGALIVKVNAVKKVLDEIAQMGPKIASFAKQAADALQQGLSAELQGAKPGMVGGPSGASSGGPPEIQSPSRELNRGFVG